MFNKVGVNHINVNILSTEFVPDAYECINNYFVNKWHEEVNREEALRGPGWNKLRTYRLFKTEFSSEPYVKCIMSKSNRSALARFR